MSDKKLVAVAMSGGVDSSLVVAQMIEKGYRVIGITMQLFDADIAEGADVIIRDARRLAEQFRIPHYVLDLRDQFKKEIVKYFVDSYSSGITPNPCVHCNQKIKFGAMLDFATNLRADFLVTGHYVRLVEDEVSGFYDLYRAVDERKDQSYVLYHLNQNILSKLLFPLGTIHKSDTRAMAKEYDISVYNKPESQDICFISDNDYVGFLKKIVPDMFVPGDIVDTSGKRLGRHFGLAGYTVGQRRGLGIAFGEPLYVLRLDASKNQVVVGCANQLFSRQLIGIYPKFLRPLMMGTQFSCTAKVRYAAKPANCLVSYQNGCVDVEFDTPQRAITPGQSVVFYDGDRLLGGAIIQKN